MADTFTWLMDASAHEAAINVLRTEIVRVYQASGDLPIATIFLTLPVVSDQIPDAVARGSFQIRGGRIQNTAADELWMQFDDPGMGSFFATIPASLAGAIDVLSGGSEVRVSFDQPIALEIPQLATLGVGRSSFQKLLRMTLTTSHAVSFLQDDADPNKETNIDVRINSVVTITSSKSKTDEVPIRTGLSLGCGGASGGGSSGGGGSGGGTETLWYVIKRNSDGYCYLHRGQAPDDPSKALTVLRGPTTWAECNKYQLDNCGAENKC